MNFGDALLEKGNAEQAMASYRRALQVAPENLRAHNNLGVVLSALGRTEEAAKHFQAAQASGLPGNGSQGGRQPSDRTPRP